MRRHPLLEELVHAALAMTVLIVALAVLYRLITGNSPQLFLFGEVVGFSLGLIILILTSPNRR